MTTKPAQDPKSPQRTKTDDSLKAERDKADDRDVENREDLEEKAGNVVQSARDRADQLVQTARDDADLRRARLADVVLEHERSTADEVLARERTRADVVLDQERSTANAVLDHERSERKRYLASVLSDERGATDKNLTGERVHADTMHVDLREANEQLVTGTIRAQELADEADEAKERAEKSERDLRAVAEFREMFIGVLGHDLRTPLGSISMAAASLLRRGHLDTQDAETTARIIRSSQRMNRMITQLLDLTRARLGGGLVMEPKPTDLRKVCQNVVEEFEAAIQLEVEGDVTGTWDADRLAEVLSNLAGNAIEYGAPGAPVLLKAFGNTEEVVVEISNQGAPIPADVLPFIFEPFRRAPQHQKSARGNLGLGLYIARQIVISHAGTLDGHSADGTTTFVMRLPRRPPPPQS